MQHNKQCPHCSTRIASSESYCANHQYGCSEASCYSRISAISGYCLQHSEVCSGGSCYQRIASYQSYCSACQQQQREQNQLKSLVKANTAIAGDIKEVERFSTDWNKNLATVINSSNGYWVFLLVLDENRGVRGMLSTFNVALFTTFNVALFTTLLGVLMLITRQKNNKLHSPFPRRGTETVK